MGVRYWLLAGLLILAACGEAAESPSGAPSSPTVSITPPSAVPGTSAAPAPTGPSASAGASAPVGSGAAVTVERSGGFVGIDQSIVVAADGRWTYRRTRAGVTGGGAQTGRLTDAQRDELQGLVANPRLGREENAPGECADGFEYTLVTGQTKVQWADCGTGAPATATKIVTLLTDATPF